MQTREAVRCTDELEHVSLLTRARMLASMLPTPPKVSTTANLAGSTGLDAAQILPEAPNERKTPEIRKVFASRERFASSPAPTVDLHRMYSWTDVHS